MDGNTRQKGCHYLPIMPSFYVLLANNAYKLLNKPTSSPYPKPATEIHCHRKRAKTTCYHRTSS